MEQQRNKKKRGKKNKNHTKSGKEKSCLQHIMEFVFERVIKIVFIVQLFVACIF